MPTPDASEKDASLPQHSAYYGSVLEILPVLQAVGYGTVHRGAGIFAPLRYLCCTLGCSNIRGVCMLPLPLPGSTRKADQFQSPN